MRGLVAGAQSRGLLEGVERRLSGDALLSLKDPTARRWWPGAAYNQLALAVVAESSTEEFESICVEMAQHTFGPIVAPMVKVTLALVGSTPGSLLSKLGLLAQVAIRGPTFTWASTGATSGTLTVKYLGPTQPGVAIPSWRATIRYACELTNKGRITRAQATADNVSFIFDVAW